MATFTSGNGAQHHVPQSTIKDICADFLAGDDIVKLAKRYKIFTPIIVKILKSDNETLAALNSRRSAAEKKAAEKRESYKLRREEYAKERRLREQREVEMIETMRQMLAEMGQLSRAMNDLKKMMGV